VTAAPTGSSASFVDGKAREKEVESAERVDMETIDAKTQAALPGRQFQAVSRVLEKHGRQPSRLIPILQAVQEEYTAICPRTC
jgi:flagellar basal body P-ring protein FlgI